MREGKLPHDGLWQGVEEEWDAAVEKEGEEAEDHSIQDDLFRGGHDIETEIELVAVVSQSHLVCELRGWGGMFGPAWEWRWRVCAHGEMITEGG